MKIIPSLISESEALSPEVQQAQRMEELRQIAQYRALKLKEYQKWSAMTPEEREHYEYDPMGLQRGLLARGASLKEEADAARKLVAENAKKFADEYELQVKQLKYKPLVKPKPKSWWQRFTDWLVEMFDKL